MRRALPLIAMALVLTGCALPINGAAPATIPSGTVLFKDDFASPSSGWDRATYPEGTMDYDGGAYRIFVTALEANFWSAPHRQFGDARVEVDAGKLGGPDANRLGLICRADAKGYYFFIVTSDGFYGLGTFQDGTATLMGHTEMQSSGAIKTGAAINHLRMDCSGNRLSGFVNGKPVAEVQGATRTHGDVGVLAGTFDQPGVDIVFDNFAVLQP
jgi:hypothetical protein